MNPAKSEKTLFNIAAAANIPPRDIESLPLWCQECECRSCHKFRKAFWSRKRKLGEVKS